MSSIDNALIFQNAVRPVRATESRSVIRLALYPGELLRIPRSSRHIHVLSGTAWVSDAGRDVVAARGACVALKGSRQPALVSGTGAEPLLLEVW